MPAIESLEILMVSGLFSELLAFGCVDGNQLTAGRCYDIIAKRR
jgi:hypothetical protein